MPEQGNPSTAACELLACLDTGFGMALFLPCCYMKPLALPARCPNAADATRHGAGLSCGVAHLPLLMCCSHRYTQLLSSCQQTLQDMLHLHHTLAQQHPAAAAALAAAPPVPQQQQEQRSRGKRSRTAAGLSAEGGTAAAQGAGHEFAGTCSSGPAAWCAVDGAISSLAGFRDAALDKWHRRTVLASGTAALRGSSGLRALQQSVSSQVAALMADKAKLISRSQLPMQLAPRPLGQPAAADAAAGAEAGDGDAGGQERMRDAETYDEGDFYQQLLKELLESGGQP